MRLSGPLLLILGSAALGIPLASRGQRPTCIQDIPLPPGFQRLPCSPGSFGAWLRTLPLRKDRTVYLYNGLPKRNQRAQYAVLDLPIGNKDLQQCADVVMRLRAEYLYAQKQYGKIDFCDNLDRHYRYGGGDSRPGFDQYLEKVFMQCGTLSLSRQLLAPVSGQPIQPGEVLVQGGSPGHAMIVVDVAQNPAGERIFLLAQGYMPAQDIHIVVNPALPGLSPWYRISSNGILETPEWVFRSSHLRVWP